MALREMLSDYWYAFQQELFPRLESVLGPMGERYELFVAVLELVRVEALLPYFRGHVARPEEVRAALARAFIAKAVFDVPSTHGLIERLEVDGRLCRLCDWSGAGRLPSEATFSRAFCEFAEERSGQIAGCDGDRSAGDAGVEAEGSETEAAQAGAASQGRGAVEGAKPAGTATDDEPSADARGPAEGLRCRHLVATPRAIPPPGSGTSCAPTRPMAGSPSAAS